MVKKAGEIGANDFKIQNYEKGVVDVAKKLNVNLPSTEEISKILSASPGANVVSDKIAFQGGVINFKNGTLYSIEMNKDGRKITISDTDDVTGFDTFEETTMIRDKYDQNNKEVVVKGTDKPQRGDIERKVVIKPNDEGETELGKLYYNGVLKQAEAAQKKPETLN